MSEAEKRRFARAVQDIINDYNELPEWIKKLIEQNRIEN